MRKLSAAVAAAIIGVASLALHPAEAQPSVAFQQDPAHTGATVFPEGFKLPLQKVWSRKWPISGGGTINDVSYPLIVNGKVFLTVTPFGLNRKDGAVVYALSLQDGRVLWSRQLADKYFYWAPLAYDNGRLFAATGYGHVVALDPETGQLIWRSSIRDRNSWGFRSVPTAANGLIFVSGAGWEGTLFALDQLTGKLVWKKRIKGSSSGAATVAGNNVFVGYSDHVYRFASATGALKWYYNGRRTSMGTGETAPFY